MFVASCYQAASCSVTVLKCILALHSLLHVNQWLSQFTEFVCRGDNMNTQIKISLLKNYSLDNVWKETHIEVCFKNLFRNRTKA